jgi:hypothetical protein
MLDQVEELKAELADAATTLLTVQYYHGHRIRAQSLRAFGKLVDAHIITVGVLGTALLRVNLKFSEITPTSTRRNALFASFVIGLSLCERAICEGRYLQAGALLRQEAETLAALIEVTAGTRQDGKTPNLGSLEPSIARLYGQLSAAAHVSRHHIVNTATEWNKALDGAPGPTAATRHFPVFEEGMAKRFYGLHLYLTIRVIEELSIDHSRQQLGAFTLREIEAIDLAIALMVQEGILENVP